MLVQSTSFHGWLQKPGSSLQHCLKKWFDGQKSALLWICPKY